ncbi:outer membrane beta-barrel protein [Psychroflexus montanilacus]|uniref:outer membrane beta-barrel protein n=1 Tax=Psychroflexus montanilacus TaxID=2873598 RepID=UPI001CCADBE3|nr:outer membrane beta-barrel protein [Psychroflexus montanilacus]MBZ9651543.1 outer membrane beta-barrel protein [Psychroflexus montanilacus]
MKHFFFFSILLLSLSLSAQINKGNWLVGGSATFAYSESKPNDISDSRSFNINLSPRVGYFFWDRLAFGLRANFTRSRTERETNTNRFNRYFTAPFARYYILESDKILNPFVESSYGFDAINSDNSREFTLSGGLAVFVNKNISYEASLNYINTINPSNERNKGSQTVLLGIGIQIHL